MDIYCKLTCNMYVINNNNLKMNGISMLAGISTVFTFCPDEVQISNTVAIPYVDNKSIKVYVGTLVRWFTRAWLALAS